MVQTIRIDDYACDGVVNATSKKVVYMIYPLVNDLPADWLEDMASKCGVSIVAVYVRFDKWNDELTPWPAPPEAKGCQPFADDAKEFYKELTAKIIPEVEKTLGLSKVSERDLVGVSLAGLFTLWQWIQFDTFTSIACLSGSFWYNGFLSWFESHALPKKNGKAYFVLGTQEPRAKIKAYQTVGVNTEAIVKRLESAGIECHFDWVPGNHFANFFPRAEKALEYLYNTK